MKLLLFYQTIIIGTVRSLWTWLWGRYHVSQNVFLVMHPPATVGGGHHVFGLSLRPSVRCPLTPVPTWRDACVHAFIGGISMKFGTDSHASEHCWKGFLRSWDQWSRTGSDRHENLVNVTAPEPLTRWMGLNRNLPRYIGRRTDLVFKVISSSTEE